MSTIKSIFSKITDVACYVFEHIWLLFLCTK